MLTIYISFRDIICCFSQYFSFNYKFVHKVCKYIVHCKEMETKLFTPALYCTEVWQSFYVPSSLKELRNPVLSWTKINDDIPTALSYNCIQARPHFITNWKLECCPLIRDHYCRIVKPCETITHIALFFFSER